MFDKPDKPERRRWYQFNLRTLLAAVALLALPCAWIGSQMKIVRARQAWLASHPFCTVARLPAGVYLKGFFYPADRSKSPSMIRRLLGDCDVQQVILTTDEEKVAMALFPEADIEYWQAR